MLLRSLLENSKNTINEINNQRYNTTRTTNGAVAYKKTNNYVLDLFGKAGVMRNNSKEEIENLIIHAMKEDKEQTVKLLFYFGDIREGMGERRFFQIAINLLGRKYSDIMRKNIELIPFYNRWDSIYALVGTPLEAEVFDFASRQLKEDLESEKPSLLAKWLCTTNDSSEEGRNFAFCTYKYFGYKSTIKYNQAVRKVRKKLNLIESKLTDKDYENIVMKEIPTKAQKVYSAALQRHIPEKFTEYYEALSEGTIERETKTLYPYEIINIQSSEQKNALWKALPDFLEGNNENILPIIDTSGSMSSRISNNSNYTCLDVAIGLGIYLAERNKGYFKDFWVNFSEVPQFYTLNGKTLSDKIANLDYRNWMSSTRIEAVYNMLLDKAVFLDIREEEMPTKIFIVSDMQFNCVRDYNSSVIADIDKKYRIAGYKRPTIVFWQVNGVSGNVPITVDTQNTMLVSGFSQNLLPYVLGDKEWSPMNPIISIVESERYKPVYVCNNN